MMNPTLGYAVLDADGNVLSLHIEHERAMQAVGSRRGAVVVDLTKRVEPLGYTQVVRLQQNDTFCMDPFTIVSDIEKALGIS